MDYATWCREGLVDYICPSYYNDRLLHFPLDDYLAAVRGTDTRLVPWVGFVELPMPGMWLARVRDCYEQGVDGIYLYQMEGLVCDDPPNRRYASVVHSANWVRQWHRREQKEQSRYSKRIYVKPASRGKYRDRERLRAPTLRVRIGLLHHDDQRGSGAGTFRRDASAASAPATPCAQPREGSVWQCSV